MNRMCFVPLSIYLFFFFYLPISSSLAGFRRSNKITSVCCRPTMTKDEKRDREKTSRADACYITRQDDSKLYLICARAITNSFRWSTICTKEQRQQKKKNMLVVYSFAIYNNIIREEQQLHSSCLQTKK